MAVAVKIHRSAAMAVIVNVHRGAAMALVALAVLVSGSLQPAAAQDTVGPDTAPNDLVRIVGNRALDAVRHDAAAKRGDPQRIDELVNQYLLPYVDFQKTTRLAAGRHWRQATDEQKRELPEAFKHTLIRTYGSALDGVDKISALTILPFRGDPDADDAVVRSVFSQYNGPSISVDYRLERTPDGWKIYDLSVEGIWLIQNYRNQFSQQISQSGIDGLIDALNRKNR